MNLFRKKRIEDVTSGASHPMQKHLGVRDLTAFGIAAIIGAGIFSTIGKASYDGGPGVIFLFIFTALACSCAAFAYAEFASMMPVSGSAYTYSFVAFGELFAWIIGWALIMEYAIGNVTVAISWSDYFTALLENAFHYHLPTWLSMDYFTARTQYITSFTSHELNDGLEAFTTAPMLGGYPLIFDAPALVINLLITLLVYRGIRESRNASNIMVAIKLIIVVLVIVVGAFYVDTANWDPFLPNGIPGLLKGISAVFFAYIGFDAISTTAEECRDPQRDLPRGILYSIIICTILYVIIALVITGMVNYTELNLGDPLAYVFEKIKSLHWLSGVIAISAVVAMASVMLVFQLGQPRIWMSMSRDGLLPPAFAKIHPKYHTPGFSTIITGLMVGIPIFFIDASTVTDICSAGTLFAFCLVCGGVLRLSMQPGYSPKFKTPYVNSQYIVPILFLAALTWILSSDDVRAKWLVPFGSDAFWAMVPQYLFLIGFLLFSVMCLKNKFSLIPAMGLLSCFYMLSQLGLRNWLYFSGWLVVGLAIYFAYGYRHSKLAQKSST